MTIYYQDNYVALHQGDCLDVMAAMPDSSVDSIVTDPPYGLGFMGRKWDALPPSREWAEACYRVLKPGGHIAAFGGTRTWHRLAVAIEDAGFEMRDSLAWLYGSGFPKSMDVGKAIDKQRDDYPAIREVVMFIRAAFAASGADRAQLDDALGGPAVMAHFLAPSRSNAGCPTWDQWQTLKAILRFDDSMDAEVWRLNGRKGKPGDNWQNAEVVGIKKGAMSGWNMDGTTKFADREEKAPATPDAERWQGWGTALKPAFEPIVLARKPLAEKTVARNVLEHGTGAINVDTCRIATDELKPYSPGLHRDSPSTYNDDSWGGREEVKPAPSGRWPANVLLDEHAAAWVDEQSGVSTSQGGTGTSGAFRSDGAIYGDGDTKRSVVRAFGDTGGASRFFYCAKAPKSERPNVDGVQHPTVKPLAIMRWLIRLVTPPGGTVLDPFAGSGTTIEAAMMEGFHPVGIEMESEYLPLITARITRAKTSVQDVLDLGGIA